MERLTKSKGGKFCGFIGLDGRERNYLPPDKIGLLLDRLAELEDKLESGPLVELPCTVGDTVYGVGMLSCNDKDATDEKLKRKIYNECVKRSGRCDGCKYALPAIEEFVCTQIQIAHDGIWICGAKAEMHLASKIFTDKITAEARLKELQEKGR